MKKRYTPAELRRSQKTHPWQTRDGLIAAIKATRKYRVCAYRGDRCDCKYGLKTRTVPSKRDPSKLIEEVVPSSEQTGCPELYEVIALLQAMTKAQFDRLYVKASNLRPLDCVARYDAETEISVPAKAVPRSCGDSPVFCGYPSTPHVPECPRFGERWVQGHYAEPPEIHEGAEQLSDHAKPDQSPASERLSTTETSWVDRRMRDPAIRAAVAEAEHAEPGRGVRAKLGIARGALESVRQALTFENPFDPAIVSEIEKSLEESADPFPRPETEIPMRLPESALKALDELADELAEEAGDDEPEEDWNAQMISDAAEIKAWLRWYRATPGKESGRNETGSEKDADQ